MDKDVSKRLKAVKERLNNFREILKSPNDHKDSLYLTKNNKTDSSYMSKSASSSNKHLDNDSNEERKPKIDYHESVKEPKLRKKSTMNKSQSNHQLRPTASKQRYFDYSSDSEASNILYYSDSSDSSNNHEFLPKDIYTNENEKKQESQEANHRFLIFIIIIIW